MTLLEVRSQVLAQLCQQDTFTRDQFSSIHVSEELAAHHDDLVTAALEDLTTAGLVREVSKDLWMLANPLQMAAQEVTLSLEIASEIATTLNLWIKSEEIDAPTVDPLHIHEGHFIMLLSVINDLLDDLSGQLPPQS